MKVLHLWAGNLYGGIERLLATYAEQRDRCPEMQPHFGLCFEGRLADELRAAGVPLTMLGNVRLSRPWTTWRARRNLAALLRQSAFDAVITHASWPHAVFARVVKKRGIPQYFMAHDAYEKLSRVERAAARISPDCIIANSRYTASTVEKLFPGTPCHTCYYPVARPVALNRIETRRKVRKALECDDDCVVIACTARMEWWKGHALLIEALSKCRSGKWEAWIGGSAQRPEEQIYLDSLKRQAADASVASHIRFLGQRNDVPDLLAAADIHCQPNLGPEPFGIAFIEAMFAGLPIVTTRLGAPIETIDESCGRLVTPGNAGELASALQSWIDQPDIRKRLGDSGPDRASHLCDVDRQLAALRQILSCKSYG